MPSHTFLTYEKNNKYYWFETWNEKRGIHEYLTIEELLKDVKEKFINSHQTEESKTKIYQYNKPPYHISCWDYYKFIEENGTLIE